MHANIAGDSPWWTKGFVYITIVNSIKSAAAMEMIETWLHGQINARQGQTATQCFPVLQRYTSTPAGDSGFTGFLWKGTVCYVDNGTLKVNVFQTRRLKGWLAHRIYEQDLNLDYHHPLTAIDNFTRPTVTTGSVSSEVHRATVNAHVMANLKEISSSRKTMNNKLLLSSFKFQAVGFYGPDVGINKLPLTQ